MAERESKAEQRDRQSREVEASQQELRNSIAQTQHLLDESDEMLKRHRRECEAQDGE